MRRYEIPGARVLRRRLAFGRELAATSPALTAVLAVLVVATGLLDAGFLLATGAVVGAVARVVRGSEPATALAVPLAVTGAVYLVSMTSTPLVRGLAEVLGRRLEGRLRTRVMAAVLGPPGLAHLERPDVLDRVATAQAVGTGEIRPRDAVTSAASTYAARIRGLAGAALLVPFAWWLAVLVVVAWEVQRWVWVNRLRQANDVAEDEARGLRRSAYFRDLALRPDAAKEIRVFGLGGWVVDRFAGHWTAAMTEVWRRRARVGPVVLAALVALAGSQVLAFGLLGHAAATGAITAGAFAVYVQAVAGVGHREAFGDHALDSGSRPVLAVAALERELAGPAFSLPGHDRPAPDVPRRAIRFEGVRFRYPGTGTDVLDGLDLELPAGRSTAVVGLNGAGKTTLVKLLARLYDPAAGRITADGTDLRAYAPRAWARRVAAVFQDHVHYPFSAADNVGFGAPDRPYDDATGRERLATAAARSGADRTVAGLPHGWDTVLTREVDGGVEPSGGQWQRLALARALHAVDAGAGVLVLDEPTAHLDVTAEADLYDRFLDRTRGLTTVLISHRFSTVRRADRIVVLEHGRVLEQGSHDELVAAGGRYAELFALQAAPYAAAGERHDA